MSRGIFQESFFWPEMNTIFVASFSFRGEMSRFSCLVSSIFQFRPIFAPFLLLSIFTSHENVKQGCPNFSELNFRLFFRFRSKRHGLISNFQTSGSAGYRMTMYLKIENENDELLKVRSPGNCVTKGNTWCDKKLRIWHKRTVCPVFTASNYLFSFQPSYFLFSPIGPFSDPFPDSISFSPKFWSPYDVQAVKSISSTTISQISLTSSKVQSKVTLI